MEIELDITFWGDWLAGVLWVVFCFFFAGLSILKVQMLQWMNGEAQFPFNFKLQWSASE